MVILSDKELLKLSLTSFLSDMTIIFLFKIFLFKIINIYINYNSDIL
jgi:hypothetical protein